ncbi:hypothetical protein HDU76_008257 [Blyttiomyces sp. JEL0837]|nr:hypothetical protein HDU76_008257 [Blyttiomyces sp. JEL0837]
MIRSSSSTFTVTIRRLLLLTATTIIIALLSLQPTPVSAKVYHPVPAASITPTAKADDQQQQHENHNNMHQNEQQQVILTGEEVDKVVPPRRVIAVGDFHGDFPNVKKVLMMAGIIDDDLNWIAGDAVFGDVVDRGPDTIKLYKLLQTLQSTAPKSKGSVYPLLGNHEVMNMASDLRYVTPEDTASFGGPKPRAEAFSKSGWIGSWLRTLNISFYYDNTVFMHGGITSEWARLGLVELGIGNEQFVERGRAVDGLNQRAGKSMEREFWRDTVFGGDGPLWYRGFAMENEITMCKHLDKALKIIGAKRMVIGHTPQESGQILSRCNGKVFVIDVGISRAYYSGCAVLEIVGDRVTALYCDKRSANTKKGAMKAIRVDMTPKKQKTGSVAAEL